MSRAFTPPWREAGQLNHHDDIVDLDQEVVNKELSLPGVPSLHKWHAPALPHVVEGYSSSSFLLLSSLELSDTTIYEP